MKPNTTSHEAHRVSLDSRVNELENEVARLKEQLGKAKGINDVMWDTVVQRLAAEGKEKKSPKGGATVEAEGAEQEESVRRRKRGRT